MTFGNVIRNGRQGPTADSVDKVNGLAGNGGEKELDGHGIVIRYEAREALAT
jgi:hypothetical protein